MTLIGDGGWSSDRLRKFSVVHILSKIGNSYQFVN